MKSSHNKNIPIIGGGPAGITTAIQLKRYGLEPLILEKREVGGLLWNANLVENYPGFPNGVSGEKLIKLMKMQAERIGVSIIYEEVRHVDLTGERFSVTTQDMVREADILVVASGTKAKSLQIAIPTETKDRIFTEVWPLLKEEGRNIVVIGAGDAAFDYALNLSKKRNNVTILNRGETVKCLPLLFERAAREQRITYRAGVTINRILVGETTNDLMVECEAETFEADCILSAIGRIPNLDFLSDEVLHCKAELVESGRLYFVGDVKNELYRQVAIAAGDGLRAAMQIYKRITNENRGNDR